ncbi:MAG: hypothetical protein Q6358_01510 [Candidatus Brocadiales bacterium]|nr:hypothetical protein [Candidatus Brocadiales bacterium]
MAKEEEKKREKKAAREEIRKILKQINKLLHETKEAIEKDNLQKAGNILSEAEKTKWDMINKWFGRYIDPLFPWWYSNLKAIDDFVRKARERIFDTDLAKEHEKEYFRRDALNNIKNAEYFKKNVEEMLKEDEDLEKKRERKE